MATVTITVPNAKVDLIADGAGYNTQALVGETKAQFAKRKLLEQAKHLYRRGIHLQRSAQVSGTLNAPIDDADIT